MTLKPNQLNFKIEVNPIDMFESMKISEFYSSQFEDFATIPSVERTELIKLLRKLVLKYRFCERTFYLSAYFVDHIMSSYSYRNQKYEFKPDLMVVGCLLLAAKFTENDPAIPNLKDIQVHPHSYFYNVKDVKRYEEFCLRVLQYKLDHFTALDYLQFLLNCGIILIEEINNISINITLEMIYNQSYLILSDFIYDNRFCEFSPLQIACTCVALARDAFKLPNKLEFNKLLVSIFQLSFGDYRECYEAVKR